MLDVGLMVGLAGIFVAALAGILGVWMERDREHPPWFALFFSSLIVFASFIEVGRSVVSAWNDSATEETMARVLGELTELSERSGDPELASFVGAELSRSNPKILKRVEKRVAARGGDPDSVKRRAADGKRAGGKGEKAGNGDAEGKAGKAGNGDAEGKAGKAGNGDAEGKAGKAGDGDAEGKAGKSADGDAEGKAGKAGDGDAEGKAGKAGKAG
jgi:hypothetical protein